MYVTAFFTIILNLKGRNSTPAKKMLGKFMIFAFGVYISHFIFYFPFTHLYPFIDPVYQLCSLLVYPMYFIYTRLLTVDESFSWKKYQYYFYPSFILVFLYVTGILFADFKEYSCWVYHRYEHYEDPSMGYLKSIYSLIRIFFVIQVFYLIILCSDLLKKHKDKAEQFYSDYEDTRDKNVKIIHTSMVLSAVFSIILAVLGRDFFYKSVYFTILPSFIFATLLFIIGYQAMLQKPINPTFESSNIDDKQEQDNNINDEGLTLNNQLNEKLVDLFENQRVFLKEDLNILHIANITGTNRTYISHFINKHYQQNFCSFVNSYRIRELKDYLKTDPQATNQILAEKCGFSSVDSLKRVVKNQTGMTVTELKKSLLI